MACFRPLKAYRAPGGGVVFDSKRGFGDRPLELPCGQCIGCRVERSRQWALRCVHESQMHAKNCFITLTYNGDCVPRDGGLRVADWQKFAKRLRKACGPFRFFHCGEYGEATKRPHYHACVFGLDFSSDRLFLRKASGGNLYFSPLLSRVWGLGHSSIGDLTYESAAYVARYVVGKLTGELGESEYSRYEVSTGEVWSVRPPYVTMSRRPGIGTAWFEKFSSDVYPSDEVVHKGRRFRPPRFYDSKLSESDLERLKRKRVERVAKRSEDLTYDRLRVRDYIAEAKAKRFERKL